MNAARARLEIAAQNLSRQSADGFTRRAAKGALGRFGVRVWAVADDTPGALRQTGRPLDLAIAGRGNFSVRRADGRIEGSRYGAFARDRFLCLIDPRGRVLLGQRGPLRVPPGATFETDGRVTRNGVTIDRIALPRGSTLRSGALEASNVDPVAEMIDLLGAQRSFESAEKVLEAIDRTRQRGSDAVAKPA